MTHSAIFRNVLGRKKIKRHILDSFMNRLQNEHWIAYNTLLYGKKAHRPFTDCKSTVRFFSVFCRIFQWYDKDPVAEEFIYYTNQQGRRVPRTWADFLDVLYVAVQEEGFSLNLEESFAYLAHAVLCVACMDGEGLSMFVFSLDRYNVANWFIRIFFAALETSLPPSLVNNVPDREPQPRAETLGEGSGEPQPRAETLGEGSGEPQPRAETLGEGSGEPQPRAETLGEGSGEPQPRTVRGVKRYRLRKTYEREMARRRRVGHLYGLRSTPARDKSLSTMEEENKQGHAECSSRSRKRSRT